MTPGRCPAEAETPAKGVRLVVLPPVVIGRESTSHRPGFEVPGSAWSTVRSACLLVDPDRAQMQRGAHGRCLQLPLPHDAASARAGVPASMRARRSLDACAVCGSTWPYTLAVIAMSGSGCRCLTNLSQTPRSDMLRNDAGIHVPRGESRLADTT